MIANTSEGDVSENHLIAEKQAYRDASRGFDTLVSGVSAAMLIAAAALYSPENGVFPVGIFDLSAILLFSLALLTSLRKVEQTVMVLGTTYTILDAEMNARGGGVDPAAGNVDDLRQAVQIVSLRATKAHRFRNWFLATGILVFLAAKVIAAFSVTDIM